MKSLRLLLAIAPLVLVGCGGDSGGSTTEPVTPVATTITLSATSVTLESLGASATIAATVKDQNGTTMTGQTVNWSSSAAGVASVADGIVTAVTNGSATITATSGSASAAASVTVAQVAASITLSADTIRLGSVGDTATVSAEVADAGGAAIEGASVTWASSDTLIVTVDSMGLVTSVGSGFSVISASSGPASDETSVISAPFYLAGNGVTVVCSIAEVGDTATVNGTLYTKRDRTGLDALVTEGKSSGEYSPLATTCTSGVTDLNDLFLDATDFNEPIASWDVSTVTDMSQMFLSAAAFNQDISGWDVSGVTRMRHMFEGASLFNQPIGSWNVSNVTNMQNMFDGAGTFDQPIGSWNVSSVTNMSAMFFQATSFDQPIASWDVSGVLNMASMFQNALAFNRDLSGWCVWGFPSVPTDFDTAASSWVLPRPVWGTCSPASTVQTAVTADPDTVWANSSDSTTITVQLKDASGTNLTASAGELTFATPSQGSVGAVTDNGDGSYSAVYTSGSTVGTITLTPSIDGGLKILPSVDVILRPTFYLAENTVTVMCPAAAVGDTATVDGVLYTRRDRAGLDALVTASDYPPLETSCTSGVVDMSDLFLNASTFNEPIGSWDVSSVTNMERMFSVAEAFNQPIGSWDVSSVTNVDYMFSRATSFNQDIGAWDVSGMPNMFSMFLNATSFNADLSGWDVRNVTGMAYMFTGATAFNGDISGWDVSSVTDMGHMFQQAASFNRDLSGWCVSSIPSVPTDFDTAASSWVLARPVWGTCPGG